MTVSTKIPASRTNGTSMQPGGGPVPAPRVVGNRRIRTGGVALAVMLLAFGAALSGIALLSASKTAAYLSVRQAVPLGSVITADDLTTVQLRGGGGLNPIPATERNAVVGLHAATSLVPGTLLAAGELTSKSLVNADDAQIGLGVSGSNLPTTHLQPGDQILLVPLGGAVKTADQTTYTATVVDVGASGSDGSLVLHIAVPVDLAPTLVTLNAAGGFGIILKPGN
jgi:hypothetical protein